jgi:thiamine-phosphate pyrophosphorylase
VNVFERRPAGRFYPIIDTALCAARGLSPIGVARACLDAGAAVLQLRAKRGGSAGILALADALVSAAAPFGAYVIVNDRADIARLSGAAGVHVGQDDLAPEDARRVMGHGIVGLSTHDEAQVDGARQAAVDYVAVGPIYPTGTKVTGYDPRGTDLVRYAARTGMPVVAIGGITVDRAPEVIAAGAAAVAVIADLVATGDVEARVREYLRVLR